MSAKLEMLYKIEPLDETMYTISEAKIYSDLYGEVLGEEPIGTIPEGQEVLPSQASRLNANGVPLDCIREQLGHSSLSTTLGYIYNPLMEKETYNLISKAL